MKTGNSSRFLKYPELTVLWFWFLQIPRPAGSLFWFCECPEPVNSLILNFFPMHRTGCSLNIKEPPNTGHSHPFSHTNICILNWRQW
jgi:hypothetical protein